MGRARRVRWECPNGLHPGVLGSTRPPKDATVRYCLPCSAEATRLVARTAPALERERAARSESATAKRERRAAAARRGKAERYMVTAAGGESIDLMREMREMLRTPELAARKRESGHDGRWLPELVVRRGQSGGVSGHCDTWGDITLTVGAGAVPNEIREVLLHELVHSVTVRLVPRTRGTRANPRGREWHGALFRRVLCRAAGENFGVKVHPDDHAEAYGLDELIIEQMGGEL